MSGSAVLRPGYPRDPEQLKAVKIVLGMMALYLIWGSTYLAVRWALEGFPPLLLGGIRFLTAGSLVYLWSRRSSPAPCLEQWLAGGAIGGMLLVAGSGTIGWAVQYMPSGQAALLVCATPGWMVILESLTRRRLPGVFVLIGLLLGSLGVARLAASPDAPINGPAGLVILATLFWAVGSMISRWVRVETATLTMVGVQMLAGGLGLAVLGLAGGEQVDLASIGSRAWLSMVYLICFGSIVGYGTYQFLLREASPTLVSTYTYVNPLVAVALGCLLGGETLAQRTVDGAGLILIGVFLVSLGDRLVLPSPQVLKRSPWRPLRTSLAMRRRAWRQRRSEHLAG